MDAVRSQAEAEEAGEALSRRLGCDTAPDEVAALRAVPVGRLLRAAARAVPGGPGGIGFGPVVDGVVLPGEPAELFAAGELHDVDLLIGANADEANLFLMMMRGQTAAQLRAYVRRLYEPYGDEVLALFPPARYDSPSAALSEAVTVMGFLAPARFAAASVAAAGGDAYLYHFARRPPVAGDLGAFHGLDLPYVFGNSALTLDVTAGADGELSAAMMTYWVSFARDGDPNGDPGGTGGAADGGGTGANDLPVWPAYDPTSDRCLVLDAEIRAAPAPYAKACDLADRLRSLRF
jgi:para-nitrobenzyl esterase